jgi:hypothetical protein
MVCCPKSEREEEGEKREQGGAAETGRMFPHPDLFRYHSGPSAVSPIALSRFSGAYDLGAGAGRAREDGSRRGGEEELTTAWKSSFAKERLQRE